MRTILNIMYSVLTSTNKKPYAKGVAGQGIIFPHLGVARRLVRSRLLILLGLALFGAGCGHQDRYVVAPAPEGHLSSPEDFAQGQKVHLPGGSSDRLPGILPLADDEYLLACSNEAVFRMSGDHLTDTHWPEEGGFVRGMARTADGSVWGVDGDGLTCRLEGEAWVIVSAAEYGNPVRGLLVDVQDRLVMYGAGGLYARWEDGGWVAVEQPETRHFVAAWSHPDQGSFLVTTGLELYSIDGETPELLVDLDPYLDAQYLGMSLYGDGHGRLVVSYPFSFCHMYDGAEWTEVDFHGGLVREVFFVGEQLIGLGLYSTGSALFRWEEGQWVEVGGQHEEGAFGLGARGVAVPGGMVLALATLEVLLVDEEAQMTRLLPPLSTAVSLVEPRDRVHLLYRTGWHLAGDGAHWEVMGRPLGSYEIMSGVALHKDPSGALLFVGESEIVAWDGVDYQPLLADEALDVDDCWLLADGSLGLFDGREFWVFAQGQLRPEFSLPTTFDGLKAMELDRDGNIWISDGQRLGFWDGHVFHHRLNLLGREILDLSRLQDGPLVAGGYEVVLQRDSEGGWTDISPRFDDSRVSEGIVTPAILPWGPGAMLVWDARDGRLLHHDGQSWRHGPTHVFQGSTSSFQLLGGAAGVYVLNRSNQYLRFQVEVDR